MRFTMLAVASGLLLGLAARGRFRHLSDHPIRATGLLVAGLALQALEGVADLGPLTTPLLICSYVLLLAFTTRNWRLVGMSVVTAGLAANFLVIALNGGMPVRGRAIVEAHMATAAQVPHLHYGSKRHLERSSDRVMLLADVIPAPQLHEVLSFGDLVMSIGIADVLFHLMRPVKQARPGRASRT